MTLRYLPNRNPACPDDIRAVGWAVAVHNDYRQHGVAMTFWLFTRADPEPTGDGDGHGRYARGEGPTDADALNAVRVAVGLPILPPIEGEYFATYCDGPHTPPQCPNCVNVGGQPIHPPAASDVKT